MSARLSGVRLRVVRARENHRLDERHELVARRRPQEAHAGVFVAREQHDRRNVLDAVLSRPLPFEDEIDLFDANEVVEAGDFVQDLPRDERRFGRTDGLREQQQRDWLLNAQPDAGGRRVDLDRRAGSRCQSPDAGDVQKLKRSSNAFRASLFRGVVVSRSTVVRGAKSAHALRVFLGLTRSVIGCMHSNRLPGSNEAHCAHEWSSVAALCAPAVEPDLVGRQVVRIARSERHAGTRAC